MTPDLSTTNTLIGLLAILSVLEALALIALIGGGLLFYRRFSQALAGIEERHIAPVSSRVNAILDDVKGVSSTVRAASDATDAGVRRSLAWVQGLFRHSSQP